MIGNPEHPSNQERNEVARAIFSTLEQKMKGRDLVFRDKSGTRRFYAVASPAGTITLHDCETGYDHVLWADGTVETGDTTDVEGAPVKNVGAQKLESMLKEIGDLDEEEMENPEGM